MDGDAVHADGVGTAAPPDAAGQGKRFQAAEDFGAVIEEDAVHAGGFERRPVQLAAGLDHEGKVLLGAQPADQAAEIGAPAGAIHNEHLDAAGFHCFAALRGRG